MTYQVIAIHLLAVRTFSDVLPRIANELGENRKTHTLQGMARPTQSNPELLWRREDHSEIGQKAPLPTACRE
jgi:hypothetical protein